MREEGSATGLRDGTTSRPTTEGRDEEHLDESEPVGWTTPEWKRWAPVSTSTDVPPGFPTLVGVTVGRP